MSEKDVSGFMPSIRAIFSTQSIYKYIASSHMLPEEQRHSVCYLSGQHTDNESGEVHLNGTYSNHSISFGGSGISDQLHKVLPITTAGNNLSRVHHSVCAPGAQTPTRQVGDDKERSQSNDEAGLGIIQVLSTANWHDVSSSPSGSPRTLALQC